MFCCELVNVLQWNSLLQITGDNYDLACCTLLCGESACT